ncbi:MAG: hypothetical protein JRH20_01470 [Deltaproteobacteria bacterium]|nr:hypothetical protein [Deltaproteobacteria bacterium]
MIRLHPLALASLLLVSACGEDDASVPGYTSPCLSPMGSVLDCPASASVPATKNATPEDACERLVQCGILAGERIVGDPLHHEFDYRWCLGRLRLPPQDPCESHRRYTPDHVNPAIECMMSTPCVALGEPFSAKFVGGDDSSTIDSYLCPDGTTTRCTATICDHGILNYSCP